MVSQRPISVRSSGVVVLLVLLLVALAATPALAQQGTITAQACAQGRVRNSAGVPLARAECDRLVGEPIQLASTGLDIWLIALVGTACFGGGLMLRRPTLTRP